MDTIYSSLRAPASFRLQNLAHNAYELPLRTFDTVSDSHPSLGHLTLLVFEAVLEVVCVALPGFIVARLGHFDAEKQKFLANLNVMLFTPCLIFTKLASQLSAEKLSDLAIIPLIFIIQTLVSYVVSTFVARLFRFNRRASNFITAMGVFGNSNSLPISLVISLAQTLKGLHWDRIPGDNDDEVAARGILYLLIFQQLGQLVRWSWGYHVLLAPKDKYAEYHEQIAEEGQYRDEAPLINGDEYADDQNDSYSTDSRSYEPAGRTPVLGTSSNSVTELSDDDELSPNKKLSLPSPAHIAENNNVLNGSNILSFPHIHPQSDDDEDSQSQSALSKCAIKKRIQSWKKGINGFFDRVHEHLPRPLQVTLSFLKKTAVKTSKGIWEFMNPPLWAMLIAVFVASIPVLQNLFFEEGSFVKNSVTSAIKSNGGVAVPLILVVLGANLANNTMPRENDQIDPEEETIGTKLLVASLLCRMVLPTAIMAPILALMAKYVNVSILDDPIFIIVCFLLSGAPSALQLAQICQINNVYEKTMGRILFQSYVVWILPSTLILVMMALETVEWATQAN